MAESCRKVVFGTGVTPYQLLFGWWNMSWNRSNPVPIIFILSEIMNCGGNEVARCFTRLIDQE